MESVNRADGNWDCRIMFYIDMGKEESGWRLIKRLRRKKLKNYGLYSKVPRSLEKPSENG